MTYWQSEAGARHRRRQRQWSAVLAHVEQEPVRKGKRGRATAATFRNVMSEEVAGHPNWPRPRARLAVDLHFATSKKQPPNLEKLGKHYLDQLALTHDRGEFGYLYHDDRQVQLLHLSAHHGWDPDGPRYKPGIWMTARTAAEAAADMREASALTDAKDRADLHDLESDSICEQLRDAERVSRSANPELQRVAAIMRATALRTAQDSQLRANDRWLEHTFWSAASRLLTDRKAQSEPDVEFLGFGLQEVLQNLQSTIRGTLLGGDPHSIALPALPRSPGETVRFREGIREAILRHVDQSSLLFPLLVPTRLTVVVVQSEHSRKLNNTRDLDNILLDLLPIVDDVMRPPQEPWLLNAAGAAQDVQDDEPFAEWKRRGLRRLRSVIQHGVWSAQVVELARTDGDPPEGALAMMLGHGENRQSLWGEALARLEEWDERDHDDW